MNGTKQDATFTISIDSASGVPFYRQIIQQIEHAILSGRLVSHSRLPTIRSLAITLKINPNTIAKAYNELEIRGIVITQVGSGTYVSDKKPDGENDTRTDRIRELTNRFFKEMTELGVDRNEICELLRRFKEET